MKTLSNILVRPRITEKATFKNESSVYVLEVSQKADKSAIRKAFVEKYKVTPLKINTVSIPAKNVFLKGKKGKKSGYKKAYIYLEKGTKIDSL